MSVQHDPADFPLLRVEGMRDLMVVALAPELEKWIVDNPWEPTLAYRQALVAFVLDSMAVAALEGMLRERGADPDDPDSLDA